jgi:hypothetical protein
MFRRRNTLMIVAASIAIACVTSVILISRAAPKSPERARESQPRPRKQSKGRNLSLRPEALSVSRRLGDRFKSASRPVSTSVGTLTMGGNQQPLVLVRRQTDTGETVEIQVGNRGLKWNDREPLNAASGEPSDDERLLAERLILDSPDQFVLAQLRGAGYFTVARNVRPTEAGDGYDGPLWNIVRVDEPQPQDESIRALSTWRLYYINVETGLPDRIEYQLNGQDIRTEFLEWTDQAGEKTPLRITWSSGGQVIMEYTARNVSHNQ